MSNHPPKNSFFKKTIYWSVLFSLVLSLVGPVGLYPEKAVAEEGYGETAGTTGATKGGGAAGVVGELIAPFIMIGQGIAAAITAGLALVGIGKAAREAVPAIPIMDPGAAEQEAIYETRKTLKEAWSDFWHSTIEQAKEKQLYIERVLKHVATVAYKNALHYLLHNLAYQTATWLATGGPGQTPMHYTENWGDFLLRLSGESLGFFIDGLSDITGFNVCQPNFNVTLNLTLGLIETKHPKKPKCTFQGLMKNWQKELGKKDFLERFHAGFNPWENDLGIALTIFDKKDEYERWKIETETKEREEGQGIIGVKDILSGRILSPAKYTSIQAAEAIRKGTVVEETYTGDIIADAINTFTSTLAGKLFQQWFQKGLAKLKGDEKLKAKEIKPPKLSDLYQPEGALTYKGKAGAEEEFRELARPSYVKGGPQEILQKLAGCIDPNFPEANDCVIDQDFRIAIEQKMTVRQALAEGLLHRDASFGFTAQGYQPKYNEGYPYRSLIILRKYRVIPVGWEIAALYIMQYGDRTYSLGEIVNAYNNPGSPFYGLVDPDWVLKAPEVFCERIGPGAPIAQTEIPGADVNNDGDFEDEGDIPPTLSVMRMVNYCVDEKSCISEDDSGKCRYFGYCVEDRPRWNFGGTSCPKQYNTCEVFRDRQDNVLALLENTLDFNNCSMENVGCGWYCQDYNYPNNLWTCTKDEERILKPCQQSAGCPLSLSCNISEGEFSCQAELPAKGKIILNSPCGPNSVGWDSETRSCALTESCTIPYLGVECIIPGCPGYQNLLPNPSFEQAPRNVNEVAANWDWRDGHNNFSRVFGHLEKIYSGSYALRFFGIGRYPQSFVSSLPLSLTANKDYTLSGWFFSRLNVGRAYLAVYDYDSATSMVVDANPATPEIDSLCTAPNLTTWYLPKNEWEQVFCNFKSTTGQIVIRILADQNANGTVWFDNLSLEEQCLIEPITLQLAGTLEKNESKLFFDRDVKECDFENDGCSEFLTLNGGLDQNLFTNGDFEIFTGTKDDGVEDSFNFTTDYLASTQAVSDSGKNDTVLKLINDNSTSGANSFIRMERLFQPPQSLANRTFFVSFSAKAMAGYRLDECEAEKDDEPQSGCLAGSEGNFIRTLPDQKQVFDIKMVGLNDQWQRFATTFTIDATNLDNQGFEIYLHSLSEAGNYIFYDDLELIELDRPTSINFALAHPLASGNVYLKKPPAYLNCRGYSAERPGPKIASGVTKEQCLDNGLFWKETDFINHLGDCFQVDLDQCYNYSLYCFADEVGCQGYRPIDGGPEIPAVVSFQDFCPAECVGYQAFKQSPTYFESTEGFEYFIPRTARQCSANNAGCDEFTNLDIVAKGGEGREYYTYLRQCQKPKGAECGTYYSWIGSDQTGYQLKVYNLRKDVEDNDGDGNREEPKIINYPIDFGGCNSAQDAVSNPFCKELYDTAGRIYYVIYNQTISCSEDCYPYRKTLSSQTDCQRTNGVWNEKGECIYQAIPEEGITCSANMAGCREYKGNAGNNIYRVYFDDFEDGETTGWKEGIISNEALTVGGRSIASQNKIVKTDASNNWKNSGKDGGLINDLLRVNKTYLLSFWAKSKTSIDNLEIKFTLNDLTLATLTLAPDWQVYNLGPFSLNSLAPLETLQFTASGNDFYLDNITIKQVSEYIYVIRNSWRTPESCDTNPYVSPPVPAPQFMLGCQQYSDRNGSPHNLKSFTRLCRQQSIGCQLLIDTFNSTSAYRQEFNIGDPDPITGKDYDDVTISEDKLVYLTNNPDYYCSNDQKGCQSLGLPNVDERTGEILNFSEVYLKNNPDDYSAALCKYSEVGCEEFTTTRGYRYFKAPGDKTCQYRQAPDGTTISWFTTGSTGFVPDCPTEKSQLGINRPTGGWAGICSEDQAGCTEYLEPISDIEKNLVYNPEFEQDADEDEMPDGWQCLNASPGSTGCIFQPEGYSSGEGLNNSKAIRIKPKLIEDPTKDTVLTQKIKIRPERLYTISVYIKQSGGGDHSNSYLQIRDPKQTEDCNLGGDYNTYLSCVGGITSPDNSLRLFNTHPQAPSPNTPPYNTGYIYLTPSQLTADGYKRVTGRFYSGQSNYITIGIVSQSDTNPDWFDRVELKETGVYYYLDNTVDYTGCNGLVDYAKGCVLFNDRGEINYKYGEQDSSYLVFNADWSPNENGIPSNVCNEINCNTNAVIKVSPDRTCRQWLTCQTKGVIEEAPGVFKERCLALGLCDSLDENGNCNGFPLIEYAQERKSQFEVGEIYQIKDLTGYSRPGFSWSEVEKISGYYPFAEMKEIGGLTEVYNGSFELHYSNRRPKGWESQSHQWQEQQWGYRIWDPTHFKALNNPYDFTKEGITQPPEGKAILALFSSGIAASEAIDVIGSHKYYLSGYLNTINLVSGKAAVSLAEYGSDIQPLEERTIFSLDAAKDWTFFYKEFETQENTLKVRIRLFIEGEKIGRVYFDNIQIRPMLEVAENNTLLTPACRLYPSADALSCEFAAGKTVYKGLYGYCLQWDPANLNQCLLWWPTEVIQGDINETGLTYREREPLYYCMKVATSTIPIIAGEVDLLLPVPWVTGILTFTGSGALEQPNHIEVVGVTGGFDFNNLKLSPKNNWAAGWIAAGADSANVLLDQHYGQQTCYLNNCLLWDRIGPGGCILAGKYSALPNGDTFCPTNTLTGAERARKAVTDRTYCSNGWVLGLDNSPKIIAYFKANFDENNDFKNIEYGFCGAGQGKFRFIFHYAYCEELVQVVTPSGKNQVWSERVDPASQYKVPVLDYIYSIDYKPFGSLVYPEPVDDPSFWDSKDDSLDNPTIVSDDLLYVGNQPLFIEAPAKRDFSEPYQVRAGSPYSCLPFPKYCYNPSQEPNQTCEGSICDTTGVCVEWDKPGKTACYLPSGKEIGFREVSEAAEKIKRLFAESYGVWYWETVSSEDKICAAHTDKPGFACAKNEDCWTTLECPGGSCVGRCENPVGVRDPNNISCEGSGNCTTDYENCVFKCEGGTNNGGVCSTPATGAYLSGSCSAKKAHYVKITPISPKTYSDDLINLSWSVPTVLCPDNIRPTKEEYCAIAPVVDYLAVNNNRSGTVVLRQGGGYVTFKFTSIVDPNQMPLLGYQVDWGDNEISSIMGHYIKDRPRSDRPHSLTHFYSYWDLKGKDERKDEKGNSLVKCLPYGGVVCRGGINDGESCKSDNECPDGECKCCGYDNILGKNYCNVGIKVHFRDHWNWCNAELNELGQPKYNYDYVDGEEPRPAWGYFGNQCSNNENAWTSFKGYVKVYQE